MAECTESDEEDIWNYRSSTRTKTSTSHKQVTQKARSETRSGRQRKTPLRKSEQCMGYPLQSASTSKTAEQDKNCVQGNRARMGKRVRGLSEKEGSAVNALEIIDVDLEFDDSVFTPSTVKWGGKSDSNNSGQKTVGKPQRRSSLNSAQAKDLGTNALTKLKSPQSKAKTPASTSKRRSSVKKRSPKKVNTSRTSLSSSQNKNEMISNNLPTIESFLNSPSKVQSKKRKSSETITLVDSSDDDPQTEEGEKVAVESPVKKLTLDSITLRTNSAEEVDSGTKFETSVTEEDQSSKEDFKLEGETTETKSSLNEKTNNRQYAAQIVDVVVITSGQMCASDAKSTELNRETRQPRTDSSTAPGDDEKEGGFILESQELFDCTYMYINSKESKPEDSQAIRELGSACVEICDMLPSHSLCVDKRYGFTPGSSLFSGSSVSTGGSTIVSSEEVTADSTSYNEQEMLTSARKQTSIFSFFKARPSSISSISSHSNHQSSFKGQGANIAARPDLRRGKTVGGVLSSVSSASVLQSSKGNQRDYLKKSASETTLTQDSSTWNDSEKKQQGRFAKQQCPFYKKIPGTGITVDAFRYGVIPGCEAYILTHFHYDHYGGLTKRFAQPIYCSKITGNLVEKRLGVDIRWINCLPMWKPCQVAGVTVTLMEANHCPGAVIILFELKDGRKILHTGDFRASPEMEEYEALKGAAISELYLDTTYCNPSYAFPPQSDVINFAVSLALKHVAAVPQTLIVCGAYTIGKERIFAAIAKTLDSKICVMSDKKRVLDCLEDPELQARLTLDWSKGQVHVLPMNKLNQNSLHEHLKRHSQFQSILAFEPTGWTHSNKLIALENLQPKWSRNGTTLYGVPYSEHSSFLELKRFVQFTRPKKILPTVNNGNPASRKKMEDIFRQWMEEKPGHQKSPTSQQAKLNAWIS